MPDYVDTTNLSLYRSQWPQPAGTAEITHAEYNAAQAIPSQYRKWTGSAVVEMNAAEKQVVDDAAAAALVTANRAIANAAPDDVNDPIGWQTRALIELLNKRDNYLTNRITELQDALDAVKASNGPADNIRAAIPANWLATSTRTRAAAVQAYKDDIAAGGVDT